VRQESVTHLLIEVVRPREVIDGGVDTPPKILKNHDGWLRGNAEGELN
jgi:hypothetical protein